MKKFAIGTLLGAGLMLTACKDNKAKTEGGAAATAEEAKKSDSHVLASKGSKIPAKGKSMTKESSGEMKDGKMNISAGGQKMEGTMSRTETTVETWTSLGDNKARRTLESKTATGKMNLNGQDQPMPEEKDPLVGLPVIVELKDGKWVASLESGEAKGDQVTALEKVAEPFNKDTDLAMYGDAPRKVGEKWNVDPKNLGGFADAKDLTGTFTVEFVEIKDFAGTPCAVLKSQFDVVGEAASEGGEASEGPKMKMKIKGEALSHRSLADKEDLEAKITSTMIMDGEAGPGMAMHVEGPFNMTTKTTPKK